MRTLIGGGCDVPGSVRMPWVTHDSVPDRPSEDVIQRGSIVCISLQFCWAILKVLNLNSSQWSNEFHSVWMTVTHGFKLASLPSA
jgi:hypothetical protein